MPFFLCIAFLCLSLFVQNQKQVKRDSVVEAVPCTLNASLEVDLKKLIVILSLYLFSVLQIVQVANVVGFKK